MKLISIVTPCYNEEQNVDTIYQHVKEIFRNLPAYKYEHIFIDNSSVDQTVHLLKQIAHTDKNVKIIVNTRNFGHIRSPYYAMMQAKGDAVISIVSDLQDPPSMIADFIKKWEEGYKIVIGTKTRSKENKLMFLIRKIFYNTISKISETDQIKNFTGFGLYDRQFIEILRSLDEPYPYFRGLISDLGFSRLEIPYTQPKREKGKTKNNFYTLYDMAMLGFVNYSKLPLRLASFIGFGVSFLSFFIAMIYLVYKLIFWSNFSVGIAPLVIGIFFFSGIQLFFLGIIGEYIGTIFTQVKKRPLVIEKERINFDECDNEQK
ncbi:glycosyltransferase family 2 protein [Bacteroidota bacterium]